MTGHRPAGSGLTGALGLCTDLYELRMVEAYLRAGVTDAATFSLLVRPTAARPWYVALGIHRVLELLESFRYGSEELGYLRRLGFRAETLEWLAAFAPRGEVWAVEEGTVVLGNEPILEVTAPVAHAQLLETAIINLVQLPTLIATKAARISLAARGRPVADFGFRRAQGLESGIEAALAAHLGGGLTTSNVEAGRRYGIEVVGTMAHSFVQAFEDETEAFRAFAAHYPGDPILLVDTYDTLEGVRRAIRVADELRERGRRLRGIRLDSGDMAALATEARRLLDAAGHQDVVIFASGGLDEQAIDALLDQGAPVDAFGVGSSLTVSSDDPVLDIVYKLVAYEGQPRAKWSTAKATLPGAKQVFRRETPDNDVLGLREEELPGTALLTPAWRDGTPLRSFDRHAVRTRVDNELEALPDSWRRPPYPAAPPAPRLSERLGSMTTRLVDRASSGPDP